MKHLAKIAVTGSHGYAGSFVANALEQSMYLVTRVDLKQGSDFSELQPNSFDAVIHFAAVSDHHRCDQDPVGAFQSNILKLYNLIEKLDNNTLFIFASTAAVYGSSSRPNSESDFINEGMSTYSQTKIIGERFLEFAESQGKRIVVLRLGTLYGHSPVMQYKTVVNGMTFAAATTKKISVVNGSNSRAILCLNDLTAAIHGIIQNPGQGVFNLNSSNRTISDVARVIIEVIPDTEVTFSQKDDPYSQFSYQLSNHKFLETFGEYRVSTLEKSIMTIKERISSNGEN